MKGVVGFLHPIETSSLLGDSQGMRSRVWGRVQRGDWR